jgi:hypothetical protein
MADRVPQVQGRGSRRQRGAQSGNGEPLFGTGLVGLINSRNEINREYLLSGEPGTLSRSPTGDERFPPSLLKIDSHLPPMRRKVKYPNAR